MNNVYPSIDELIPEALLARVPASLVKQIRERYQELGPKYLTQNRTPDGRQINACMYNSSIQDCREEVVDAVFNTLVWVYKQSRSGEPIQDNSFAVLTGLIEIFGLLAVSEEPTFSVK